MSAPHRHTPRVHKETRPKATNPYLELGLTGANGKVPKRLGKRAQLFNDRMEARLKARGDAYSSDDELEVSTWEARPKDRLVPGPAVQEDDGDDEGSPESDEEGTGMPGEL